MIRLFRFLAAIVAVSSLCIGGMMMVHAGSSSHKPAEHIVEITGSHFFPEGISVKAGDSITWLNRDIVPHSATAYNQDFDTGELKLNEMVRITFKSDQVVNYYCRHHPAVMADLAVGQDTGA